MSFEKSTAKSTAKFMRITATSSRSADFQGEMWSNASVVFSRNPGIPNPKLSRRDARIIQASLDESNCETPSRPRVQRFMPHSGVDGVSIRLSEAVE